MSTHGKPRAERNAPEREAAKRVTGERTQQRQVHFSPPLSDNAPVGGKRALATEKTVRGKGRR
jgi:hypothetical protein